MGRTVVQVADREVDEAFARSFLAQLPAELAGTLRGEGERVEYPAGTTVYTAGSEPQAALVVRGLIRVYLSSPGGRQVTVRYARAGDVLGVAVLVGGPASTSVQTLEPTSAFRISARTLIGAVITRRVAIELPDHRVLEIAVTDLSGKDPSVRSEAELTEAELVSIADDIVHRVSG